MNSNDLHPDDRLEALALAVTHGKEIFEFCDIKSIRESCKSLKAAVDYEAFICTKLTISIDGPPHPNFKAIAASLLLRFIRHLELSYTSYTSDDELYSHSQLPRCVKRMLPIVEKCAPHLVSLTLSTPLPPDVYSFGRRLLRGDLSKARTLELSALKHLTISPVNQDTIATAKVTVSDLQVLAQAPFIENLKYLNMTLFRFGWSHSQYAAPNIIEPLIALLQEMKSLEELELQYVPNLACLLGVNFEKLTTLVLKDAYVDLLDYSSLRSLQYFTLEDSAYTLPSLQAFACGSDGVSQMPISIKLTLINNVRVPGEGEDDVHDTLEDAWIWLQRLNLTSLEEVCFRLCTCTNPSEFFRIGYAAETLPNLKTFIVRSPWDEGQNFLGDEDEVCRTFFSSTLAAKLETFEVYGSRFTTVGYQIFLRFARNMKKLLNMEIHLQSLEQFHDFYNAGDAWGWPSLKDLVLEWEFDSSRAAAEVPTAAQQEETLEDLWPDASVMVFITIEEEK